MPEYDEAFAFFHHEVLELCIRADPLLSQVPVVHRSHRGLTRMTHERRALDEPTQRTEVELAFSPSTIRETDIEQIAAELRKAAATYVRALAQQFFAMAERVTEATGQQVDYSKQSFGWDMFIDMIDRMPAAFDSTGKAREHQIIVSEQDFARLKQLGPLSEEQQRKLDAIFARKKAEHDRLRRHRRLPR